MTNPTIEHAFGLAQQHHSAGNLKEAERLYREIIAQRPAHCGAIHYLGVIAHQTGRSGAAVGLIRRAIDLGAASAEAHSNLGSALHATGEFDQAIAAVREAIRLKPNHPEAYNHLGNALAAKGDLDQARAAYAQAIAFRPDYADAYSNLGNVLAGKGDADGAIAAYRKAVALRPNYPEALCNLGVALRNKGQLDDAIAAYRRAVDLAPGFAEAYNNLGVALFDQGAVDQAVTACREAIAIRPRYAEAHSNLANALKENGQFDEAIAGYQHAISLSPKFARAHFHLALAQLARGDFQQGWSGYEWRLKCEGPDAIQSPRRPQWNGARFGGHTVLLRAEQGLGDTIQFIRYLPHVAERGGRVIVECQVELERLLRPAAAGCMIVPRGNPLPAFDLQCPLASLPRIFATTLQSIPAHVPYLFPDPTLRELWRQKLTVPTGSIKIGLAWAGNPNFRGDRRRSISLNQLAPLAQVTGAAFFSLQKGDAALQGDTSPPGLNLANPSPYLHDLAETAAVMSLMDLVITTDTSVAHLAGALGRSTWVMLQFVPDWRWLLEREDSPWYPSMRLFRQRSRGDWAGVVSRIVAALSALIGVTNTNGK